MKESRVEAPAEALRLFEGFGIEIEYMIVSDPALDVLPVADRLLAGFAGEPVNEVESGPLRWSNELALHVIELKTNGPAPSLDGLAATFQADVDRINALLRGHGGRLMPTAMHPWMDPARETRLWPHGDRAIYAAFDRIFGCAGHGWSNLQSMHINLPFRGDAEFARLHAAIRPVLALLPALAASSPLIEGRATGRLDNRLAVYADNARRIPSVSGAVVPEPLYSRAAYESGLLGRIYRDLEPHDPEGTLRHEWVNARGAIARFDRSAIEIRLLDTQECTGADIAVAALVTATVRALAEEAWCGLGALAAWEVAPLAALLRDCVADADRAVIRDRRMLELYGFPEHGACLARDLWQHLIETLRPDPGPGAADVYALYIRHGSLARRILGALGPEPGPEALRGVYARLCDCLSSGQPFDA